VGQAKIQNGGAAGHVKRQEVKKRVPSKSQQQEVKWVEISTTTAFHCLFNEL
jgi:hypothetical protein